MKANSTTLSFLPLEALEEFAKDGSILGAKNDDGRLLAYLLYARYPIRCRIVHLCVASDCRGLGIAPRLFEQLKNNVTSQYVIQLNCRRDFPTNDLWPRLGFIPIDEKPARSGKGRALTSWEYRIVEDGQLDLFREKASNSAMDVVIDAHVLFHLGSDPSIQTATSQALLADFLVGSVDLCITDEIYIEINRKSDDQQRRSSR